MVRAWQPELVQLEMEHERTVDWMPLEVAPWFVEGVGYEIELGS